MGLRRFPVVIAVAIVVALAVGAIAVLQAAKSSGAAPLEVAFVPIPPLGVPGYDTRGAYPQVARKGVTLRRVNVALRRAYETDERAFARFARDPSTEAPTRTSRGIFDVETTPGVISASTAVVSVLTLRRACWPLANHSLFWFAATVAVPSGRVVHIADLFASRRGLAVLRRLTLLALPRNPLEPRPDPGATWGSYRFFALTPRGLDIAFPQGVVGSMADGEPLVTIPYAKLASVLSPLGRRLVAGVRAPVSR